MMSIEEKIMMSKEEKILAKLGESNINLAGELVRDMGKEDRFYAFVQVSRGSGGQKPTNYTLRLISEGFKGQRISISFILVEGGEKDIQASVNGALFRFFPDIVRNVFVAFEDKGLIVWVEQKKILTDVETENISAKVLDVLKVMGVPLVAVKFTSSENTPTPTACLNSIRLESPLTQDELHSILIERGFHIPNMHWLSKVMDKLRRAGLVLRRKDEQFVLTLKGLSRLGTSKHGRSPDVFRALAIAKRGE